MFLIGEETSFSNISFAKTNISLCVPVHRRDQDQFVRRVLILVFAFSSYTASPHPLLCMTDS